MIHPLITRRNRPKVTMVIGIVITTRIGFTIALKNAKTNAVIKALPKEATSTPGNTYAKIITASAVKRSLSKKFMT